MSKDRTPGPDLDAAAQACQRIMSVFTEQFRQVDEAWSKAFAEWKESPSGQYLLAVADYYDQHPDELQRLIAAREAEATVRNCHCLCPRWSDHTGACEAAASTVRSFPMADVPMCGPCASAFDARSDLAATR